MAHIVLAGVPAELHQAAIDLLSKLTVATDHTAEVRNEAGARIYGLARPEPAPQPAREPARAE